MNKVLVTPRSVTRSGHPALEKLRAAGYEVVFCAPGKQPGEDELRRLLPGCAGYLAGVEPVTANVLDAATELRVISRNGTGVDNVDLTAAKARGIMVLRAEGANARGVAELAIGQLFALARGIAGCDAALKRKGWERGAVGIELEGRILGLAGCGKVGKLVAHMALGLGMNVIAFDPYPDTAFVPGPGFRYSTLEEVFENADFLSLHCPPCADGHALLDTEAIARLKPGVFVINTARYELLEGHAVLAALHSGQIAGLALDVFNTEPPTDFGLAEHPHVIVTPHIGGFTRDSIDRAMTLSVDNLLAALHCI
ncbi:MAG: hypothetical protein JWL59_72 [Chthoniobacteraceae bacterium]|nr:hypothetical protein [Chthoniobacteraceae bacterium]